MGFGLCDAPDTFARLTTHVLDPFIHHFIIVYLDDICIYSKSPEEHLDPIRQVLIALRKNNLFIKMFKCFWPKRDFEYLCFLLEMALVDHLHLKKRQLKIGPYLKRRAKLNVLWLSARFIVSLFATLRTIWLH